MSPRTAYRLGERGELETIRITDGRVAFVEDSVEDYVLRRAGIDNSSAKQLLLDRLRSLIDYADIEDLARAVAAAEARRERGA